MIGVLILLVVIRLGLFEVMLKDLKIFVLVRFLDDNCKVMIVVRILFNVICCLSKEVFFVLRLFLGIVEIESN